MIVKIMTYVMCQSAGSRIIEIDDGSIGHLRQHLTEIEKIQ